MEKKYFSIEKSVKTFRKLFTSDLFFSLSIVPRVCSTEIKVAQTYLWRPWRCHPMKMRTYGVEGTCLLPKSVRNFRILQHSNHFQSNVLIFPSVVQAYTQLYSFSGRINLIICQIKYELSVTIHKIRKWGAK